MDSAQEAKLVLQLRQGNQKAITEWFLMYHDRLLKAALQRVELHKDAEELVQETFLNCMRQIALFRGSSTVWTWMNAVLRHEISDFYRKRYAKNALRTLPLFDTLPLESVYESDEVSAKVTSVLKKMSSEYRELLQQKYVDKKKVVDIAKEWGKTCKSIESELFRARKEFQYLWVLEEK